MNSFTPRYLTTLRLSLDIPVQTMSFADDGSLSLAGLDAPDFLQLDNSSSLTAHCHSFCTTATRTRDSDMKSPQGPQQPPVVATEVRIGIYVRLSPPTLSPPHRVIFHPSPTTTRTSLNLSRQSRTYLRFTSQSFGTYTLIHPPSSTSLLPP